MLPDNDDYDFEELDEKFDGLFDEYNPDLDDLEDLDEDLDFLKPDR